MARSRGIDPHESAPQAIKELYKRCRKLSWDKIVQDPSIIDLKDPQNCRFDGRVEVADNIPRVRLAAARSNLKESSTNDNVKIYEVDGLPGMLLLRRTSGIVLTTQGFRILPKLVSMEDQITLLSSLLHDSLADPRHNTNVHLHHLLPYKACREVEHGFPISQDAHSDSFFHLSPQSSKLFVPVNENTHKAFRVSQFLSSKLRWITLGEQYDWTAKKYASGKVPIFPKDIASFIGKLFPEVKPEAAIVNIYRPGDFLNMHRDISEESDKALISISLGCDGILIIGLQDRKDLEPRCAVVRLQSGDAIYMAGPARFAWHGLPQVIPNSCPDGLRDWPAGPKNGISTEDTFEAWRGWMANTRVNLSVRQVNE